MRVRATRLTAIASAVRRFFSPSSLFSAEEQGVWYDPSDLSTLFQDAAGTTPVTAVEQPVGLMLDKSGRGNHATQTTSTSRPVLSARYNLLTKTEQFDDAAWSKGGVGTAAAPSVSANASIAPDGTNSADLVVFNRGAGTSGDRSVLFQAPTLAAGTYTQSVWLKAATDSDVGKQLAIRNVAGSTYFVVTLTSSWVRYDRTEVWASNNWEITNRQGVTADVLVSAHIWGASLVPANQAHLPYQRVNTATDYDADPAKFPPYLKFDGVDDGMVTNSINFTATDKMTVFAGVRKLSDAAAGAIVELSNYPPGFVRIFSLSFPASVGALDTARWTSRGTLAYSSVNSSSHPAPASKILTGVAAIDGDVARLSVNGAVQGVSAADQGDGPFGNYPLYIGRRGDNTVPFSGHLYSLIVRGAATPDAKIAQAERWVAKKTGVTL